MLRPLKTLVSRLAASEPKPPWGLLDVTNSLSIALIAMFLLGPSAALIVSGGSSYAITPLVGWLIGGLLTAAYVLMIQGRTPAFREALRLGRVRLPTAFILLFGMGVAILLDLVSLAVTRQFLTVPELASAPRFDLPGWIVAFAFLVVMQPVAEELVFRGILLPRARGWLGAWGGLIVCAMLYAAFHALVYPPSSTQAAAYWYALALPLLAGAFFSAVRAAAGSTRAAITVHVAFGLFYLFKALVQVG